MTLFIYTFNILKRGITNNTKSYNKASVKKYIEILLNVKWGEILILLLEIYHFKVTLDNQMKFI